MELYSNVMSSNPVGGNELVIWPHWKGPLLPELHQWIKVIQSTSSYLKHPRSSGTGPECGASTFMVLTAVRKQVKETMSLSFAETAYSIIWALGTRD